MSRSELVRRWGTARSGEQQRAQHRRAPGPRPGRAAARTSIAAPTTTATASAAVEQPGERLRRSADQRQPRRAGCAAAGDEARAWCRLASSAAVLPCGATVSAIAARQAKPCEPRAACGHSAARLAPCSTPTTRQPRAQQGQRGRARGRGRPRPGPASGRLSQVVRVDQQNATQVVPVAAQRAEQSRPRPRLSAPSTAMIRPPSARRRTRSTRVAMSLRGRDGSPRPGGRAARPRRRARWRRGRRRRR